MSVKTIWLFLSLNRLGTIGELVPQVFMIVDSVSKSCHYSIEDAYQKGITLVHSNLKWDWIGRP